MYAAYNHLLITATKQHLSNYIKNHVGSKLFWAVSPAWAAQNNTLNPYPSLALIQIIFKDMSNETNELHQFPITSDITFASIYQ